MPPFEFAGDISWGYNPAHLFAIESNYGGPDAFKRFIRDAHEHGIARDRRRRVQPPRALAISTCGGSTAGRMGDGGGIYFYNDGAPRRRGADATGLRPRRGPDVPARQRDDLAPGVPLRRPALRLDAVHPDHRRRTRRRVGPLPDGWSFLAWINDEIRARQPWKITIAEDLQGDPALVAPTSEGGAGFAAQWDAGFIARRATGARRLGRRRPRPRRR